MRRPPPPRLILGAVVLTLVTTLVVLWQRHDSAYVVPAGPGASASASQADADPALASIALHTLETALRRRDASAAAALAPAADPSAAQALRDVVGNAERLDLSALSLRYVDEAGAVVDGRWTAAVDLTWKVEGFDVAPAEAEVGIDFQIEDGRAAIAGFGAGSLRAPLWWVAPLTVGRTRDVIVAVARPSALRPDLRLATTAVRQVAQALPGRDARLVVEVPSTESQLDAALDADPGTYAGIAAVTAPVDGSQTARTPVHIFVNPEQFDRLKRQGAQVVMTHEAVHAVTHAVASRSPLWLVEGFADFVALQYVDLPISTTARELIAQVRADGVPRALPDTADFDVASRHLDAVYESAWIACTVLADRAGAQALTALYDRTSAGEPLAATLRATTGVSLAELTRSWRDRLAQISR